MTFEEAHQALGAFQCGANLLKKKFTLAEKSDYVTATKSAALSGVQALQMVARSSGGAWAYPLKGVVYMAQNREIWNPILTTLLLFAGFSLAIIIGMFIFTFVPQMAVLAFITGPLAPIVAFFLVLAESYFVISLISKIGWLEPLQDDLFDAVLVNNGQEELVKKGREVGPGKAQSVVGRLGKKLQATRNKLSYEGILQYLVTLPLNFIPVVGNIVFLVINGSKSATGLHARYFQLKGFDVEQSKRFVDDRRGAYTGFGGVSLALTLIPIVSIFFVISNTIGAALWAVDLEKQLKASPADTGKDAFLVANEEARKEWRRIEQ
jgi:uncharacterized protein involved in cysteine biosynthesis